MTGILPFYDCRGASLMTPAYDFRGGMTFKLPDELVRVAAKHAGPTIDQIVAKMRRPGECMTPSALNAQKATRLSFTQLLAQRMIAERWQFSKERVEFDAEGRGWLVYQIDFGKYLWTRC